MDQTSRPLQTMTRTRVAPLDLVPEYSVADLSAAIKEALESGFSRVRVRGEITEFKRAASGHAYLALKDEGGKISGVIWRSAFSRLSVAPENGLEVVAIGKVSSYGDRSTYQLIIEDLSYTGEGTLLAKIERLRKILLAEGLFRRSQEPYVFPLIPKRIGVVTSASGAVLRDIYTTLSRRFPSEILLWPVPVQGREAPGKIVEAIRGITGMADPPDILIVARGGGSLEDLMAFNEEEVVRAVAASPLPVISAIGHETDTTLIDFAADRRAATPTAAAELAVPVMGELLARVTQSHAGLLRNTKNVLYSARQAFQHVRERFPEPENLFSTQRQRLEDRSERLENAPWRFILACRQRMESSALVLPLPTGVLTPFSRSLEVLWSRAEKAVGRLFVDRQRQFLQKGRIAPDQARNIIRFRRMALQSVARHFEAVSPRAILERGYVRMENPEGLPLTRAAKIPRGALARAVFFDGVRDIRFDPESSLSDSGRVKSKTPRKQEELGF